MKINIICVGKIKEKSLTSLIAEYQKRCGKYCSLLIKELPDKDFGNDIEKAKSQEGELILKAIDSKFPNVILDVSSNQMDSVQFAKEIEKYKDNHSGVNFIIGGSHGFSDEVLKSGKTISFSRMTFPHQLFRVFLIEQIYRGFRILNNEPYHK